MNLKFVFVRSTHLEAEQKPLSEVAIQFLNGPLAEKIISIQQAVTMIGRDAENDIAILDPKVSKHHACIRWHDGSWTIENLSLTSYVAINQQRTQQGVLQHNSVVSLGEHISFVFLAPQTVAQPQPAQPTPALEPSASYSTLEISPMQSTTPA